MIGKGNWYYEIETNPLTDNEKIVLFTTTDKEPDMFSSWTSPELVLILEEGKKDLYINFKEMLGYNSNTIKVRWRFDKGDLNSSSWILSKNRRGAFFPEKKENLKSFVKNTIKAKKLIVGYTPNNKDKEKIVIFYVDGLGETLLPYLEKFEWEELKEIIEDNKEEK